MEDIRENNIQTKVIEVSDPFDPFDNPTENKSYNSDYSHIVPYTEGENVKLTLKPLYDEKRAIKHFYNLGGGGIAVHFLFSFVLSQALYIIIAMIIMEIKDISFSEYMAGKGNEINDYVMNSSISNGINILTFLTTNLITFFVGIKIAGIKFNSLFKTESFTVAKALQYILIGLFFQFSAGIIVSLLSYIMPGTDIMGGSDTVINSVSQKSLILSVFYTIIVAPVTEELFFRGFVMKSFSRVSQRFGILVSAVFFGLSHGNIAQFSLAFLLGIFMGFVDIKHNSLIPSILIHLMTNLSALLATLISGYAGIQSTEYIITSYVLSGLAIIGFVALIFFCRKNTFPKATIAQNFRCKNLALRSVGTIAAIVIYGFYIIDTTFML